MLRTFLPIESLFWVLTSVALANAAEPNLVTSFDDHAAKGELSNRWRIASQVQEIHIVAESVDESVDKSLRVKVVEKDPGRYGEISQTIPVEPNTQYQISGWIKGSAEGIGFYQVKRRKGSKELERIQTPKNSTEWKEVRQIFNSGDADNVIVLCRWHQSDREVGETVWFAAPKLVEAEGLAIKGVHAPVAIATFESIGLYWKPLQGSSKNQCRVWYRAMDTDDWKEGHPLWFDSNIHDGRPENSQQYRGSLVHLSPDTNYQIRLQLETTKTEKVIHARTWSEEFKVKKVSHLPSRWSDTLKITEGGSEQDGYVVYTHPPGERSVGDAKGESDVNIEVNACYVILRGLTLQNAAKHGIELKAVDHVVIEDCDISGWGEVRTDGFGENGNAAVYGKSNAIEHLVIQACDMHDPRSHSNSWNEERDRGDDQKTFHPMGPQGITIRGGKGRYVIRYNKIRSDAKHMFNDGMGEFSNFSFAGFPNRDSDIYGNWISHCCDDGIESEGANMNVRVWDNCTDTCMMSLAGATTSLGPIYFFRNISLRSRYGPTNDWDGTKGGGFLKLGNESTQFTKGRMYVYHNTIYQPTSWPGREEPSGCRAGIICTGQTKRQQNLVTRNNILHCRREQEKAIRDDSRFETNDFDFDLIWGQVVAAEGSEKNGAQAIPQYLQAASGQPSLQPGSPGHDAGCRILNFNDNFRGKAPDMGAAESGINSSVPVTWPKNFPDLFQFK